MRLEDYIRDIPDFPKPGIVFKDITPLLQNPKALGAATELMVDAWAYKVDAIAALDARGFIFGSILARELELPFIPIRKKGKLPFRTVSASYGLEYGKDTIEMHVDACEKDQRVLIVDDLLATGGTAGAAITLVEQCGGKVAGCSFVIELKSLDGRSKLGAVPIQTLLQY